VDSTLDSGQVSGRCAGRRRIGSRWCGGRRSKDSMPYRFTAESKRSKRRSTWNACVAHDERRSAQAGKSSKQARLELLGSLLMHLFSTDRERREILRSRRGKGSSHANTRCRRGPSSRRSSMSEGLVPGSRPDFRLSLHLAVRALRRDRARRIALGRWRSLSIPDDLGAGFSSGVRSARDVLYSHALPSRGARKDFDLLTGRHRGRASASEIG